MDFIQRSSTAEERPTLNFEEIFGNDNGEDENPKILASYFIEHASFNKALEKSRRLEIAMARKGMGKSALLSHLKYRITEGTNPIDPEAMVIKVTGNELIGLADFSGIDSSLIENRWKQVICKRISMEIAASLNFAGSNDTMSLIEAAEIEGLKGKNIVSGLMTRIGNSIDTVAKVISLGTISINPINPTDPSTLSYEHILKRIQAEKNKNVWLLIDDIDAKFVDTHEFQVRIGAFFSALRSLAFSVEGLKVRASVRTDVWTNLRNMEDQDKLRQYVTEIKWSDDHLRNIFAKRILSHLQRNGDLSFSNWNEIDDYARIMSQIFDGNFRIGSEKKSDPLLVAMMLAGKRPRWMGQLCKQAGGAAGGILIQQRHFDIVMGSFGKEKISDLIKEHRHQFSDLQKVIDAFRNTERNNSRFKLSSIVKKGYTLKCNQNQIPPVNGFPFKDIDQISKLLFEIDFIVGEKGGKHTQYHQDPSLFEGEHNLQNKIQWMVNLSYRRFLAIQ